MQIPVDSETVRSIGYDACSRVLRVAFGSGGTYECDGVPLQLYEAMLMPHPGRRGLLRPGRPATGSTRAPAHGVAHAARSTVRQ